MSNALIFRVRTYGQYFKLACSAILVPVAPAGIQIEEPFHVLPMHAYCSVIAKNALEVVRERKGA